MHFYFVRNPLASNISVRKFFYKVQIISKEEKLCFKMNVLQFSSVRETLLGRLRKHWGLPPSPLMHRFYKKPYHRGCDRNGYSMTRQHGNFEAGGWPAGNCFDRFFYHERAILKHRMDHGRVRVSFFLLTMAHVTVWINYEFLCFVSRHKLRFKLRLVTFTNTPVEEEQQTIGRKTRCLQ